MARMKCRIKNCDRNCSFNHGKRKNSDPESPELAPRQEQLRLFKDARSARKAESSPTTTYLTKICAQGKDIYIKGDDNMLHKLQATPLALPPPALDVGEYEAPDMSTSSKTHGV